MNGEVVVMLYINDVIITKNNMGMIEKLEVELHEPFKGEIRDYVF